MVTQQSALQETVTLTSGRDTAAQAANPVIRQEDSRRFKFAGFNPYHKWLGIPDCGGKITYYQLLGLQAFEADADVIETAADARIAHLRTLATGPRGELAEKLLNELAQASRCLLTASRKARYDEQLQTAQQSPSPNRRMSDSKICKPPKPAAPRQRVRRSPQVDTGSKSTAQQRLAQQRHQRQLSRLVAGLGVAVTAASVMILTLAMYAASAFPNSNGASDCASTMQPAAPESETVHAPVDEMEQLPESQLANNANRDIVPLPQPPSQAANYRYQRLRDSRSLKERRLEVAMDSLEKNQI